MNDGVKRKRTAGGAATAAGINFQAAVAAIAGIYMARGQPLGWMSEAVRDIPVALELETGSGGDDIRLHLAEQKTVEIQVKKGLTKGEKLWKALLDLASEVSRSGQTYGLLVVSTTSSDTIRTKLANDIVRIGDGCVDNLSDIAFEFLAKLKSANFDSIRVCSKLRIYTVAALSIDQAAVAAAKAELAHICANDADTANAWTAIYADSTRLIEHHGRRDLSSFMRVLAIANISVADANITTPTAILSKLTQFNFDINANFSILGMKSFLQTDRDWITLKAAVRNSEDAAPQSIIEALRGYHNWETRVAHKDDQSVDPDTLARFVKRAVLVAGPGMGKTTLLKRIARRYSEDKIPVLKVRLSNVAARMKNGSSFEEAIFHLGLDGSGISFSEARDPKLSNWLILCDGLDECGSFQQNIAEGVSQFAIGYPDCRIIVTTRPVGYRTAHFQEWRHYDLVALDASSAYANVATILEAISESDTDVYQNAWSISRSELMDKSIAEVVGRTPLLIGFAAAILAKRVALGASKEALFDQVFSLIDGVADIRPHDRPDSTAILRRFVDILGWQITLNPICDRVTILQNCGKILAIETGTTDLKGLANAESCLNYWEQVGLVEQLGFGERNLLTFIHKSFGEFAAARHLCSLPDSEQTDFIAQNMGSDDWAEPLRFAASLGLADKIAAQFVADYDDSEAGFQRLSDILRLTAEVSSPPRQDLRATIFRLALNAIAGSRAPRAYKLSKWVVAAAKIFPDEIGPLVEPYLRSDQDWSRHIAWHCAVAAGPEYYSLDGLIMIVEHYVADTGPRTRPSPNGGLIFDLGGEREMTQEFALAACSEILDHATPEIADSLVPSVFNHPSLGSVGFLKKAQKLAEAKGKKYAIGSMERFSSNNLLLSEAYRNAEKIALSKLLDFLGADDELASASEPSKPLLNLSAFLEASGWLKIPVSDVWNWSEPYDEDATKTVVQSVVAISGIDPDALKNEAAWAKRHINAKSEHEDRWWYSGLFEVTTTVDTGPMTWAAARKFASSKIQIEAALAHPSHWVVWLAANLLENVLEADELEPTVQRLLNEGSGYKLWAACGLAAELSNDVALELIYARLEEPLVGGIRHLFNFVVQLQPEIDAKLIGALKAGLFSGNERTACAAASLAKAVANSNSDEFIRLIDEAIEHWKVHESPYPEKGGAIPKSPRDDLVAAIAEIAPPTYDGIKAWLAEKRHDIRKVGEQCLLSKLATDEHDRAKFFKDIVEGELPVHHLGTARKAKIPLTFDQLATLQDLLKTGARPIRLNAISILDEGYLDTATTKRLAAELISDKDGTIRERAHVVLDKHAAG